MSFLYARFHNDGIFVVLSVKLAVINISIICTFLFFFCTQLCFGPFCRNLYNPVNLFSISAFPLCGSREMNLPLHVGLKSESRQAIFVQAAGSQYRGHQIIDRPKPSPSSILMHGIGAGLSLCGCIPLIAGIIIAP